MTVLNRILLLLQVIAMLGVMESALAQDMFQDRWSCLQEEDSEVGRNKKPHDQLFWAGIEKHKGAVPCVGVLARNLHGPGFSVCGKPKPHFVLRLMHPDSSASDAGRGTEMSWFLPMALK